MSNTVEKVSIPPMDEFNQELIHNVHPADWQNPTPKGRYNLVVIGAGTAGLVTAAGAAGLGAKVALIERHLMGGDCLNVGCVPSKAVIRASRAAADMERAAEFGIRANGIERDFGAAMQRLRRLRAQISHHDSASRFQGLGIDVYLGGGKFTGDDTVEVAGQTLRFKKAVIATGARAFEPPIPGLAEAGFLTNETVFNLTELPKRVAVIGGGPIGCELAQSLQRFGAQVTIFEKSPQFLVREDPDAAEILANAFRRDGVQVKLNSAIERVERGPNGKTLSYKINGEPETLIVDEIIVGAGRAPNIESLDLDAVGVKYNKFGVEVDDSLRTANSRIYAAGDVCMKWKFTHAADFAARIVIQNTLFFGRKKLSALTMPWATYTDPEIAHVGLYERDAEAQGVELDTYIRHFKDVDRAILDGDNEGFVKVHTKKGTDKILGATIVAAHAGDMISEISVAMAAGMGLGALANVIHPYPTQAEAIRQIGDAYNKTRLTPLVHKIFKGFLALTR